MTYPEGIAGPDGATASDRDLVGAAAGPCTCWPDRSCGPGTAGGRRCYLRVVLTTLPLSLVVLLVLAQFLLGRVTDGLLAAKERSALDEARAGLAQAQLLADAAERGGIDQDRATVALVDGIARQLANRAGNPSIYEVLLLGSPTNSAGDVPEFGSNQVSASSVPLALRDAVRRDPAPVLDLHRDHLRRRAGPPVPGFAVGAPLALPEVGAYELYYLFPLNQEAGHPLAGQAHPRRRGHRPRAAARWHRLAGHPPGRVTRCGWPPAPRSASRPDGSRNAWPWTARTTSPSSRRRSTRWRGPCRARSASWRISRACSGGSCPTCRTSSGPR